MKKTQFVEIFRMIGSTKAFCVTMAVVTALSIASYTGISFATTSLKNSCEAYYDGYGLYDIQLASLYGFDEDTVNEISKNPSVEDAAAAYTVQNLITVGTEDYVAEFFTETGNINRTELVSGRLPEKDGECAAEQQLLDRFGLKVGDTITLEGASDMLRSTGYTIVGSVNLVTVFVTNDYYNRGTSSLGDGQVTTKVLLDDSAFSEDAVKQVCYVTLEKKEARGTDAYYSYVEKVAEELMSVTEAAGKAEYERIVAEYQEKIANAQAEYDENAEKIAEAEKQIADAEEQLADARAELNDKKLELDEGKQKLADAEAALADYQEKLINGREKLDKAAAELEEYKAKLAEAEAELAEAGPKLESAKGQLNTSRNLLDSIRQQLEEAAPQLEEKQALLESYRTQLETADEQLKEAAVLIEDQRVQLAALEEELAAASPSSTEYRTLTVRVSMMKAALSELQQSYDEGLASYEEKLNEFNEGQAAYDSAYSEYTSGLASYEKGEKEYAESFAEYETSLAEYESGMEEYSAGVKKYNDSYADYLAGEEEYANLDTLIEDATKEVEENSEKIADAEKSIADAETTLSEKTAELEDNKAQLAEKQGELADAAEKLAEAKEKVNDIPESVTYSSDIRANASYHYYSTITSGTDTVVATLCTLLMGIAILVCFTTVSRMVSEQHRIIGAQKAMGFLPREIYGKYIFYVAFCTLFGTALGVAASYFLVEKLVYQIVYGKAFVLQTFTPVINWKETLIIAVLELTLMCLSTVFACHSMLKKSAIDLLNSNIRSGRGTEKEGKSKLPLRVLMVLRNLKSNPQIFLTTLVSVTGCTILMVAVFTVHHATSGIAPRQFDELQHYDGTLTLNSSVGETELEDMKQFLEDTGSVKLLPVMEKFVGYRNSGATQYATLIGIDPDVKYSDFIEILDVSTQEEMKIPEKGVLICKKAAENGGYSVGDKFVLVDSSGEEHETLVAGIFERNIGLAVIVSTDYYAELMNTDTDLYQYYVMGDKDDVADFLKEARTYAAYCNYSDSAYYEAEMEYKVSSINKVILVVLVITGLLSLFVLFNLAQMNVRKKEKEIVVMKVLGFPFGRVRGYVFWEAMIMCTVGLVLGVLAGGPVGSYLAEAVEIENLQDIRGISISSCLIGAGINFAFYTATNLLSLIGIRKIKMTGSAREA